MTEIALDGPWTLRCRERELETAMALPGDVHSALMRAGLIEDPRLGLNEAAAAWVGEAEWELERTVEVPEGAGRWLLEVAFVDTVATLFVDDRPVAALESCFEPVRLDLTAQLAPGPHRLKLVLHPAAAAADARAARQPFPIPWSESNNRLPNMNMIRKPQCHAGWDWGPCIMVAGVYAAPRLRRLRTAVVEAVRVAQDHASGRCRLALRVRLCGLDAGTLTVRMAVGGQRAAVQVAVEAGSVAWAEAELTVEDPRLWWPNGYGEQPLYELAVDTGEEMVTRRLGLRDLRIDTARDVAGSAMTVVVNGVAVTAKGANWVPADSLPGDADAARYRQLLEDCAAANMTMVRVWGGGFYEQDVFYDLCDALGLLVWQDMMFSCSQYPSTDAFLAQVDREVRTQVERLGHHACIALWCGDNEVIGSLTWYRLSIENRDRYLVNYDRLNRTIDRAARESDPTRTFWPSSPCNGTLDYGDGWHDDGSGDMHFWEVWHGSKDFAVYRSVRPRFCSEFGFQSFPAADTLREAVGRQDLNLTEPAVEHRQRDRGLNARIIETMARYFRMPLDFDAFCLVSQLQQAMAIDTAVRAWRGLKPHCMGMLYWQLNDVWPAISWSSIDWSGRWKALHYWARRFFAPLAVDAGWIDGRLAIRAANDGHDPAEVEMLIRRVDLVDGVVGEAAIPLTVPPDRAVAAETGGADVAHAEDGRTIFVVDVARGGVVDPMLRTTVLPVRPKRLELPAAGLSLRNVPGGVSVAAEATALFAWVDVPGRRCLLSDNSFTLLPGEARLLQAAARDGGPDPDAGAMVVRSLRDTY